MRAILKRNRAWDLEAAKRVTRYVANGKITQDRIMELYGVESEIVHPPVAVERFEIGKAEDFLLFVGQIVPHKRVEVALEAARIAGRPIKIVGEGPDRERLEGLYAGPWVEFCRSVSDAQLVDLYSRCVALIVPNVEEFGIAAVEAQAAGRPVVAVDRGGARETVVDGRTGVLVPEDDPDAMAEALRETDFHRFDVDAVVGQARRFSVPVFQERIRTIVAAAESTI